ncbi:uncharacterized protein LOC108666948 [Hyalella azteca]|uniref:Uncharacterized protein LOC108666948 n=1 Tax=Hyalella azteca TaxID=294128 RepID=A0A979FK24_HYAAZ|nr:uncharacterized protein LOC108666948 [Hyalella azteca]
MSHKISKCQVLLHQLPAAAVGRGWCAMPSLAQVCADAGSVKCEVLDAGAASSAPEVPIGNIKEELLDEMEIISVKDEPFNYDEKACEPPSPGCGDPLVPPPPLCVPCKREAPSEARESPHAPQQPSAMAGVTEKQPCAPWKDVPSEAVMGISASGVWGVGVHILYGLSLQQRLVAVATSLQQRLVAVATFLHHPAPSISPSSCSDIFLINMHAREPFTTYYWLDAEEMNGDAEFASAKSHEQDRPMTLIQGTACKALA